MTTDGSDELMKFSADLASASITVGIRAGQAMGKALTDIQAGAQNRAPVDTGALKSSITNEVRRTGATITGEVGPNVSYGAYVERGAGIGHDPQPYLRPATDAVLPGYEAALGQLGADLLGGR